MKKSISVVLVMVLTLSLILSSVVYSSSNEGNAVSWNPKVLEVTVYPGSMQSFTIDFVSSRELGDVSLNIVPEISGMLSIDFASLDSVAPEQVYEITATFDIPLSTAIGTYDGTVHLKEGTQTVPQTLKVVINVVAASSTIVPSIAVSPSSDRITTVDEIQKLVKDEIVVVLDFETPDPSGRIAEIASLTDGVIIGAVPATLTYQVQYNVPDLEALEEIRLLLESLPDVEAASHHFITDVPAVNPNDTEYDAWDENNPGGNNWGLEYISAPSVWDFQTGSSDVVVGVIDGDFDRDHGDLNDNVVSWNGPRTSSFDGHGTHVAGIIGAEGNNTQGVTGVSWDVSLRLYEFGGISAVRAQEAMVQAVDDDCRIVNMSLGWIDNQPGCAPPGTDATLRRVAENNAILQRAILYAEREDKDVLWVFAAGNECRDARYQSPASLTENFPLNTITVASVDQTGNLSWFSNFGDLVTVAAPGSDILSTIPRSCLLSFCWDRYDYMSGTSMATPHVSGLAALIISEYPDKSATEVKQCIVASAESYGKSVPGHDFKVIHAEAAVNCLGFVPLPTEVDLVFSVDLTGSMSGEISRLKTEIDSIINFLETIVSPLTDFRFGVVSYEDYAGYFDSTACGSSYWTTYGMAGTKPGGDAPFRIEQVLTDDIDAVTSTITGLVLGYGGDGPQSYGRVYWEVSQADTGVTLGWRTDALKLLVDFGDNVPHDTDLNQDVESPPYATFDTGVDPGRNNAIDCGGDDIDFQDDALAAMVSSDIKLLHIHSGSTTMAPYWQYWTSVTGGAFAQINSDGSIPGDLDLTDLIVALLELIP